MVSVFWGVHGLCKEVDEWKLGARVLCRCQHLTIEQMLQDRYIDVESHGIDLDPRSNNQKLDALGMYLQALEIATDGMADNKLWQSPGDPVEWVDAKNDEERGKKFLNKCSKASAVKIKHVCTSVAGSTAHWCAEAARNHTTGAAAMIHGSVAHHVELGEPDGGEMEEHGRRVGKSATSSSNVSIRSASKFTNSCMVWSHKFNKPGLGITS